MICEVCGGSNARGFIQNKLVCDLCYDYLKEEDRKVRLDIVGKKGTKRTKAIKDFRGVREI